MSEEQYNPDGYLQLTNIGQDESSPHDLDVQETIYSQDKPYRITIVAYLNNVSD